MSTQTRWSSSSPGSSRRSAPASRRPRPPRWRPPVATARPRCAWCSSSGPTRTGFVFFTNYDSRKGGELAANPRAALLFYWEPLGRQVRVEGPVQRTSREETRAYAHSRPRGSQISALASPQSSVIENRAVLERRVSALTTEHEGAELPVADHWGGFRLVPEAIEFWQQREDRLHDRLRFTPRDGGGWQLERLAP